MTIRTAVVPLAEIHDLRWSVLRPGLPRPAAAFPEDDRPDTFHLAAYAGPAPAPLACITVFPDPLPDAPHAFRFRGMASAPSARGQGYGAAVLAAATTESTRRGATHLWCNGRAAALPFYASQGFTVSGPPFDIPGIGEHFVLVRGMD
ncbi:GNAT family N-acetyltransferase [Streptomyces sp. DSM 44917]|uniref:GNAT family N-acetyltransferase n=1 Tax=Streptomyces boetiae TaxID=3075541 RepID=A0ABU2LG16_9ACTN|nr:GNAT family N-acetyltransferase [Streptomyces sp. DSM 44917]MDT0310532.1 GNAT family N-acetyltransferase [Streptomyces sp. DSM 44917]